MDMLMSYALVFDAPVQFKLIAGSSIINVPVSSDDKTKFDTLQSEESDDPLQLTVNPILNLYGNLISFPKLTRTFSAYDVTYATHHHADGTETDLCIITANDNTEFCSFMDTDGEFILLEESDLDLIEDIE
jgi:hypothetical protein